MSGEKEGHNPVLIANFFISLKPPNLTLIKLVKLCYIAHGFSLALLEKPLSNKQAEALEYGPGFLTVLKAFDIYQPRKKEIPEQPNFSKEEKEIMRSVFDKYGSRDGWLLSEITNEKHSPWEQTFQAGLSEIDNDLIKDHYKKILKAS